MAEQPKPKSKSEKQASWLDDLSELPGDMWDAAKGVGNWAKEAVTGKYEVRNKGEDLGAPPETDASIYRSDLDMTSTPGQAFDAEGRLINDYDNMDPDYLDGIAQYPEAIAQVAPFENPTKEAQRMREAAARRRSFEGAVQEPYNPKPWNPTPQQARK